jgi:methanogenic corrinoid protein MtbC1
MNSLGSKLKKLRIEKQISQKDFAKVLEIGQTTVANYEADIRKPNLEKLSLMADFFDVSIDELLGRNRLVEAGFGNSARNAIGTIEFDESDIMSYSKAYLELLLGHKKKEAIEFISSLYQDGILITDIYSLFVKSMHEAGRLWENGIINTGEEHYISEVTQTLISHLSLSRERINPSTKKSLIVNAHGEEHTIASKILADYFERSGIETYYLGRDIPLRSLIDYLISTGANLLTISVTMEKTLDQIDSLIRRLKQHPKLSELKILVGGQAFEANEDAWRQVGADGFARDFDEAVKVAHDLLSELKKEPENG